MDLALPLPLRTRKPYGDLLNTLNRQSVAKHYDAFADIDWDASENEIAIDDERFELGAGDALGSTEWYRTLPQRRRAQLGLHVLVCRMKTGLEFERVLSRGLLEFAELLSDGSPEFRYAYHEVIEESQHTLMFAEFVRRAQLAPFGMEGRVRFGARRVPRLGRAFPELFFIHVLGGEAPIDRVQKRALAQEQLHPLVARIMQIHVTEEARHLCFARRYLEENVSRLGGWKMFQLRIATPFILADTVRAMMEPPSSLIAEYRIPRAVLAAAYHQNPEHQRELALGVAPIRDVCRELGIITPRFEILWKRLGI